MACFSFFPEVAVGAFKGLTHAWTLAALLELPASTAHGLACAFTDTYMKRYLVGSPLLAPPATRGKVAEVVTGAASMKFRNLPYDENKGKKKRKTALRGVHDNDRGAGRRMRYGWMLAS